MAFLMAFTVSTSINMAMSQSTKRAKVVTALTSCLWYKAFWCLISRAFEWILPWSYWYEFNCVFFCTFVPQCQGIPDPNCNPMQGDCTPKVDKCKLLETHGLPPDEIRQAGDMGNIIVQAGQVCFLWNLSWYTQCKLTHTNNHDS